MCILKHLDVVNCRFPSFMCNLLKGPVISIFVSKSKYFKVLMEAVGDQVSPTISLFCRSPVTTILNFNLSRLTSDWILAFYTYMHWVTGSPSFWSSTRKSDCWLYSLSPWELPLAKVSLCSLIILLLQKSFLVMEWNGKLLNQIIPKVSILAKIPFKTVLNNLCKPFPMLHIAFNAPFHSDCLCLILSRIL